MTFSSDCECLGKANPTYSVKQKLSKTEQGALPNMTFQTSCSYLGLTLFQLVSLVIQCLDALLAGFTSRHPLGLC